MDHGNQRGQAQLAFWRLGWVGTLIAVAGCAANDGAGPTVSAMQHPTLENVPIPDGFRLVDDHSFGVASGQTRVGKFEFEGGLDRTATSRFFKEYMPSGGWSLKKEDFDRGIHDLWFESKTEECLVRLRRADSKTVVGVQVGPIPRAAAQRDAPPMIPATHEPPPMIQAKRRTPPPPLDEP